MSSLTYWELKYKCSNPECDAEHVLGALFAGTNAFAETVAVFMSEQTGLRVTSHRKEEKETVQ